MSEGPLHNVISAYAFMRARYATRHDIDSWEAMAADFLTSRGWVRAPGHDVDGRTMWALDAGDDCPVVCEEPVAVLVEVQMETGGQVLS